MVAGSDVASCVYEVTCDPICGCGSYANAHDLNVCFACQSACIVCNIETASDDFFAPKCSVCSSESTLSDDGLCVCNGLLINNPDT